MTKKPSLYVVERKEVIILVVLFMLVTILAFTMGVKYGEGIGSKNAEEKSKAVQEVAESQSIAGGHLGETPASPSAAPTTAPNMQDAHSSPEAAAHPEGNQKEATVGHGAEHNPAHGGAPDKKPETSAIMTAVSGEHQQGGAKPENPPNPSAGHAAEKPMTDKAEKHVINSKPIEPDTDEYLLKALKDAGMEQTKNEDSAKAVEKNETASADEDEEAALPSSVKGKAKQEENSYYVIQVASYPTSEDAAHHVERLKLHKLEPFVLPGVDSGSGKWYRVALGRYTDKGKAIAVARSYKSKGWIENYFVRKMH